MAIFVVDVVVNDTVVEFNVFVASFAIFIAFFVVDGIALIVLLPA